VRHPLVRGVTLPPPLIPNVYAGEGFTHRESGGTVDAPDLGSG